MTISFRGGEAEEAYREFCDERDISYSEVPKNVVVQIGNDEEAQELVGEWLDSGEPQFIDFLMSEEADEEYQEAFNRIKAGIQYGLDDQVVQGVQELDELGYEQMVDFMVDQLDDRYNDLLD